MTIEKEEKPVYSKKKMTLSNLLKLYINDVGGARYVLALIIILFIWMAFNVSSNYWVVIWVTSKNSHDVNYFIIYIVLGVSYCVFEFIRVYILYFGNIKAVRKVHHKLTSKLLKAPISKFYDKVPLGKILSRYSQDMAVCDTEIPDSLSSIILLYYLIVAAFFISLY